MFFVDFVEDSRNIWYHQCMVYDIGFFQYIQYFDILKVFLFDNRFQYQLFFSLDLIGETNTFLLLWN